MGRRLFFVMALTLLASSCTYTEILRINADGSAVLRVEFDIDRADQDQAMWSFLRWKELEELDAEINATDGDDNEAARRFVIELLALEGTEKWIEDALDTLVFEAGPDRAHLGIEWDIADLADMDDAAIDVEDSFSLAGATLERGAGGTLSLTAPARDTAATFVAEYFALEGDPFVEMEDIGPDAFPMAITVEVQVPGSLDFSDAHERDGNTVRWRWEFGTASGPGIQVGWHPSGGDGWFDRGWSNPLVLLVLVPVVILAIGFLAATFGVFEALRVRPRDHQEFGRRNDSP